MSEQKNNAGHTPGPWRWSDDLGSMMLVTPDRGRLIVMDFTRKGMHGSQPRFAVRSGDDGGVMRTADELGDPNAHPDARLIAAAPDLLKACERYIAADGPDRTWQERKANYQEIEAAIARATGKGGE